MLRYQKIFLILISIVSLSLPGITQASVINQVQGYIVLQVEKKGEAWYVDPSTLIRYYLGRPDDAFSIMRQRGLGISDVDLAKIPTADQNWDGTNTIMPRIRGRIVLQVEAHGEAWYIYPKNNKRYYLGRPSDAFTIMRQLGLGITNSDLTTIPTTTNTPPITTVAYSSYTISTAVGNFAIQLATLPRQSIRMVTDTGNETNCSNNCLAKSLADYVSEHKGLAGIHGTYFCPPDYSSCAGQTYTYLPPVFNSNAAVMINSDKLPFHNGPMMAVTKDNTYYYFHRTIDFGYSVAEFEQRTGKTLQAAIANYPSLIENGKIIVDSEPVDDKQKTKGARGGIGYNDSSIFLVTASSASVPDLAYIFQALNATYAMNLDGGGSTALYTNGEYKVGPGRLLPNAIVFTTK